MDVTGEIVFLGYNDCARRVLAELDAHREEVGWPRSIRVVTTRDIVDCDWVERDARDYADQRVFADLDWTGVDLAVLFHQLEADENPSEVDIDTVTTALRIPDRVPVVAEIVDEEYADVMRSDIDQSTKLVYKERLDANLISNTIVNPGDTSEMLHAIVDRSDHRIRTFEVSAFLDAEESSVEDLRRKLLDEDRIRLLAVKPSGEPEPQLNPGLGRTVERGDVLYCLVSG